MSAPLQSLGRSAARRYLGPFPKGAALSARLSWTRQTALKIALPFLPILILAVIVIHATWAYVLCGVWAIVWGGSLVRLTLDIRRARQAEHSD